MPRTSRNPLPDHIDLAPAKEPRNTLPILGMVLDAVIAVCFLALGAFGILGVLVYHLKTTLLAGAIIFIIVALYAIRHFNATRIRLKHKRHSESTETVLTPMGTARRVP